MTNADRGETPRTSPVALRVKTLLVAGGDAGSCVIDTLSSSNVSKR
jgi:hypothetical protein